MVNKEKNELEITKQKIELLEKFLDQPSLKLPEEYQTKYNILSQEFNEVLSDLKHGFEKNNRYLKNFNAIELALFKESLNDAGVTNKYNDGVLKTYDDIAEEKLLSYLNEQKTIVKLYEDEKKMTAAESFIKEFSRLANPDKSKEKEASEIKEANKSKEDFNQFKTKKEAEIAKKFLNEGNFKDDKNIKLKDNKRTGKYGQEKFNEALIDLSDGKYKNWNNEDLDILKGIIEKADKLNNNDGITTLTEMQTLNAKLQNSVKKYETQAEKSEPDVRR